MTFSRPPRIALPSVQVAPISPATLELMRRNLAARAEQHAALGDDHGARRDIAGATRGTPMTDLTRRAFLAGAAALPVVAAIGPAVAAEPEIITALPPPSGAMMYVPRYFHVGELGPMETVISSEAWRYLSGGDLNPLIPITSVGYTNADGEWVEWDTEANA